jgi:hypothetical protein
MAFYAGVAQLNNPAPHNNEVGVNAMTRTQACRLLAVAALAALPGTAQAGALYFPEMSSASESSYAGAGMVARAKLALQ